jgi:hypothetical protein|nr:MAG TPA: hypothetical protein [Caudoviricetes sp.]
MERRMDARLTEAVGTYMHMPASQLGRSDLREVLDTLVGMHRQIATQSDLNGLVYWLRAATSFCIVSAAGLSGKPMSEVAVSVRGRANSWAELVGLDQRSNPSKMLARGLRSVYEVEAGNIAYMAVRSYNWEGPWCGKAAGNLLHMAGALLPTSIYFEAIRDGVRPAFKGNGEQLTLF